MNSHLEKPEELKSQRILKANIWFLTIFVILILLIVAFFYMAMGFQKYFNENLPENRNTEVILNLKNTDEKQAEADQLQNQIEELESGIERQKKDFEKNLEEMKRKEDQAEKAETLEERDKFAGEKLDFLRKVEELRKDRARLTLFLTQIQAQNYESNSEETKSEPEKPENNPPPKESTPSQTK